jgi:hypothetical protein
MSPATKAFRRLFGRFGMQRVAKMELLDRTEPAGR